MWRGGRVGRKGDGTKAYIKRGGLGVWSLKPQPTGHDTGASVECGGTRHSEPFFVKCLSELSFFGLLPSNLPMNSGCFCVRFVFRSTSSEYRSEYPRSEYRTLGIGRSCLKPGGGDLSHADT